MYICLDKMKNKKYHTWKKSKTDASNTYIHDRSVFWLRADTSIKIKKSGGVKLVLRAQTSLFSDMMWSCKYWPHVSKMLYNALILNIMYNIFNPHDTDIFYAYYLVLLVLIFRFQDNHGIIVFANQLI